MLLGALSFRKRTRPDAPPMRIAILIPAHNEEHQIAALLEALANQHYPEDQRTVFVIADNCTDATAAIARAHDAVALERHDLSLRGKGHALDWCLKTYHDQLAAFDAIALIDADMHVDPDFLREIAASLAAPGVEVVQGLNTVANPEASPRAALGYASFTLINHVRPAGRCWLGGTAELKGSGMAFRSALLLRTGWPAHTLAEDADFSKRLLLDGIVVHYNPDARVTSNIPLHDAQARIQQQRWEGGKIHVLRTYLPLLLRAACVRPSIRLWDAVADILVPPLSVYAALWGLAAVLAIFVAPRALWGLIVALLAVVAAVVGGLLLVRAPSPVWRSLLAAPWFMAWKLPLYAKLLLLRGESTWQRTPRDAEIKPPEGD